MKSIHHRKSIVDQIWEHQFRFESSPGISFFHDDRKVSSGQENSGHSNPTKCDSHFCHAICCNFCHVVLSKLQSKLSGVKWNHDDYVIPHPSVWRHHTVCTWRQREFLSVLTESLLNSYFVGFCSLFALV